MTKSTTCWGGHHPQCSGRNCDCPCHKWDAEPAVASFWGDSVELGGYRVIVADPPWTHPKNPDKSGDGYNGRTSLPYSSMTLGEIAEMPVSQLAHPDGCRLYLWVTHHQLRNVWDVAEAWGFESRRLLVWVKTPRATMPITTEFVLTAKRGRPSALPWHPTNWFEWPLQPAHSMKPPAFYDLVEGWCDGPYLELFARQPRLGWHSWGRGTEVDR